MFIRGRLAERGLELNDAKTKVIYCKEDDWKGKYEHVKFDFLGYTFQPRRAKNRWGEYFVNFLPTISAKAAKTICSTIRGWRMASTRNNQELEDLVRLPARFDGIFANAFLFHVPCSQLAQILRDLAATLRPGGVLFCSNPRGRNEEGWADGRYGCFHDLETWGTYVTGAGFRELRHYYRPPGLPQAQRPWLATVWRKGTPAGG